MSDLAMLTAIAAYRQKFWNNVNVGPNIDCWEWTGGKYPNGYGSFDMYIFGIRNGLTHRLSWMFAHGKIPKGLMVLHKCDNRTCVNPDHLFLGTHQDNMTDRQNKKRHGNTRKTHCKHGHPFSGDNLVLDKNGWRKCRACKVINGARERAKKRLMLTQVSHRMLNL